MNLRQLTYFRAIAELGSFARAAQELHVTQPTLSAAIAQLEEELGARLFERTTRSLALTEFGALLQPEILDVLDARDALLAKARTLIAPERALLRIGVSPLVDMRLVNLMIEPVLRDDAALEAVFRQMNLLELYEALDHGKLDFLIGPEDSATLQRKDWGQAPLYREPLLFVARHGSTAEAGGGVTLAEIAGETLVMAPDVCGLSRTTRALFAEEGLRPREYAGHAMSYAILREWADLGIGAAILPASKIGEGQRSPFPLRDRTGADLTIGFNLVWRHRQPARVEALRRALLHHAPALAQGLAPA